jgi:hypothetical protein
MQLPEEAKKFDAINKAFKGIMTSTNQQPNVIKACTSNNCFDVLTNLGERLDKCQKSLTDYLDTKRNAFSRFYFISDDELLSVLGSSDPTSIQVHMLKLFDNVKELIFTRNAKSAAARESTCRDRTSELARSVAASRDVGAGRQNSRIDVDAADAWTDRWLPSSSRRSAQEPMSEPSNTRTLKSC